MRDRRARVCVATDVAARGLDLPDLGLVIHAQIPVNKATLLHRSGRTGRAGKKGVSVLLVPHTRRRKADMLIGNAGIDVTWSGAPTAEEIRAKDETRLLSADIFAVEASEEDLALARRLLAEDLSLSALEVCTADLAEAFTQLTDAADAAASQPEAA